MVAIVIIGCLFLTTFGFAAALENETEIYLVQNATDGITELTVNVELPVRIIIMYLQVQQLINLLIT